MMNVVGVARYYAFIIVEFNNIVLYLNELISYNYCDLCIFNDQAIPRKYNGITGNSGLIWFGWLNSLYVK